YTFKFKKKNFILSSSKPSVHRFSLSSNFFVFLLNGNSLSPPPLLSRSLVSFVFLISTLPISQFPFSKMKHSPKKPYFAIYPCRRSTAIFYS
uniref:Uncharacterized protein n=1 Tax=Cucumis melo TaxID=3656 RepID=A0A9I9E254_CUCME